MHLRHLITTSLLVIGTSMSMSAHAAPGDIDGSRARKEAGATRNDTLQQSQAGLQKEAPGAARKMRPASRRKHLLMWASAC
jgi:hypothetical protein